MSAALNRALAYVGDQLRVYGEKYGIVLAVPIAHAEALHDAAVDHQRRVSELLAANGRDVDRRRNAEAALANPMRYLTIDMAELIFLLEDAEGDRDTCENSYGLTAAGDAHRARMARFRILLSEG